MKRAEHIKRNVILLVCFTAFLSVMVGAASGDDDFGYRKKDKDAEHKKVTERLLLDKGKVEKAILTTKTLIDRSTNRPYLPELYLRLAELHIEKSRIVYFIRKNIDREEESSLDQLESNSLKNQAIEIYQRIVTHFPDFKDLDKVHFFMAHEYRELGQFDQMIAQYRAIIKKHPNSGYVPEAYLLLGDYFINKEDLDLAKRHYHKVLDYPDSPAIAIARYKLAWCHINKAEYHDAIALFEKAVVQPPTGKDLDVDTYKRVDIRLESLIDMAFCYGECYKKSTPQQALDYFRNYAWSRQVYVTVLEKLAYRYLLKKKWKHAATAYRELCGLQHDAEKLLDYSKSLFECVQAIGSFEDTDQDIQYIVNALKKQKYSIHIPDKTKKTNLHDYELYARDLVTHAHEKARKKKSVADFRRAADSYKLYLDFFEDSPVVLEMAGNYAETLFSSEQYFEAGKQYEKMVGRIPETGSQKEDVLYSAVISYYSALKQKEKLNYYQTAYARAGLKTTGQMYAAAFPKSRHVPDVLFNVAWISYDAGKYDEAIQDFTSFVDAYPYGKPAKAAIHLILDSYHLKEDYENLIKYGRQVLAQSKIKDAKFRKEVAQIVHATETKMVSSLTLAALDDWEKGKSDLLAFADKSRSSGMGEEALNALIVSSQEKGDLDTLLTAGEDLIRRYPSSSKIESTLGAMIDSTLKAARYRLVADYLELFARHLPNHANTQEFLNQAGWIRKDLGQYAQSTRNFQDLIKRKVKDASQRDEVVFAMADNAVRMGRPNQAIGILTSYRNTLTGVGKARSDAQTANLYLQSGDRRKAGVYRKKAYQQYKRIGGAADSELNDDMARMAYHNVQQQMKEFMALKLEKKIDNNVAARKAKLLENLEKEYQSVMNFKSPDWALMACYRSYEINREFSVFLLESPLPDLSPEEKKQYTALIYQKAEEYTRKADQYYKTCVDLAHKWEICDPELASFFARSPLQDAGKADFKSFSGKGSSVEINARNLTDRNLIKLHKTLSRNPNDKATLAQLCEAYIRKGDFRQALLISQKIISESGGRKDPVIARFYNNLGISQLYIGNDRQAKDAFQNALDADADSTSAKINLAGLYSYYGHSKKADKLYGTLPKAGVMEKTGVMIHPHARELYYVQHKDA